MVIIIQIFLDVLECYIGDYFGLDLLDLLDLLLFWRGSFFEVKYLFFCYIVSIYMALAILLSLDVEIALSLPVVGVVDSWYLLLTLSTIVVVEGDCLEEHSEVQRLVVNAVNHAETEVLGHIFKGGNWRGESS